MTTTNQKGFTLVEIAIVLVIIGLLLGGVLQGQILIKNAKIKSAASDVNGYQVALYGYQDRFGDLFNGVNHLTAAANPASPTANEMVNELIARDLVGSRGVNAGIQQHALGGNIVLHKNGTAGATGTSNNLAGSTNANPIRFNWAVCYQGIEIEEDARALIRAIDGSNTSFATATATATAPAPAPPPATAPATAPALNGFNSGRARLVNNTSFAAVAAFSAATTTVCFNLQ